MKTNILNDLYHCYLIGSREPEALLVVATHDTGATGVIFLMSYPMFYHTSEMTNKN